MCAKGNDLALGNEAREFILAGVAERADLDAAYFGANGGCQVCHGRAGGEQIRVGCVGVLSMLDVLKGLKGRVLLVGVPGREVVGVLEVSGR